MIESDSRTAQLLRRSGYLEQRQSFCVAVARSVDPREMDSTARAQRMVESIGEILRDTPVRSLIGVRDGLVTIVMSGTQRLSGWTATTVFARRTGISAIESGWARLHLSALAMMRPSTSHVRRALNEARLALDFASVSNRVMPYSQIPFRQMIIRHARDNIQSALPAWLEGLQTAGSESAWFAVQKRCTLTPTPI